jgi:hypothetical protein
MAKPSADPRDTANDADREDTAGLASWRRRDELRRSNAARPHVNRKRYTRKSKHPSRGRVLGDDA